MKIALIGYGKMGKIIEAVAIARGHEIVLKIDLENIDAFVQFLLEGEFALFLFHMECVENDV